MTAGLGLAALSTLVIVGLAIALLVRANREQREPAETKEHRHQIYAERRAAASAHPHTGQVDVIPTDRKDPQ